MRESQKGKGRCAKELRHIGQQASGEGGIRTLGDVAATPVFETGPIGRSGTSPLKLFPVIYQRLTSFLGKPACRPFLPLYYPGNKVVLGGLQPSRATPPHPKQAEVAPRLSI